MHRKDGYILLNEKAYIVATEPIKYVLRHLRYSKKSIDEIHNVVNFNFVIDFIDLMEKVISHQITKEERVAIIEYARKYYEQHKESEQALLIYNYTEEKLMYIKAGKYHQMKNDVWIIKRCQHKTYEQFLMMLAQEYTRIITLYKMNNKKMVVHYEYKE